MATRTRPPLGAPTWVDLWSSDVERARNFYGELFGWESSDPDPAFGGYFQFLHGGAPIAGGSGDMPDNPAKNIWTGYFHSDDASRAAVVAAENGATLFFDPMAVADLGTQFQFSDPQGAHVGVWQPDNFVGFTALGEPGAPSWFELHTRDHTSAAEFYAAVLGWEYDKVSDVDEFRYWTVRDPDGSGISMAGLMDNRKDMPDGTSAYWRIYWETADVDETITTALSLGATVSHPAVDTPYGRLAELSDPMGAAFSLRRTPA